MKFALTGVIFLLCSIIVHAQSCLPDGITFQTQEEINSFKTDYPACTSIEGNVLIKGDEINSLQGLNEISSVGGRLRFYSMGALPDMSGLESLETIDGDLDVYVWPGKETVLTSLTGLQNLVSVGGDVSINGTDKLTDLNGLDNLQTVNGDFTISANTLLDKLSGLERLKTIKGKLWIGENTALTNLSGLDSLISIGGDLEFYYCQSLENLSGINSLQSISGSLKINTNESLLSLSGLETLSSISGYLEIYNNTSLTSIESLQHLDASTIQSLTICDNTSLSTCAVSAVCNYISSDSPSVYISDNAAGCTSETEVSDACNAVSERTKTNTDIVKLYPNPVLKNEYACLTGINETETIEMYALSGQLIKQQVYNQETQPTICIKGMPAGIYLLKVHSKNRNHYLKLIIK